MDIPSDVIRAAQQAAGETPDGILGPRTLAALREYDDEVEEIDASDQVETLVISVAQHAAGLRGKDLDGRMGPRTERAVKDYLAGNGLGGSAASARTPGKPPMAVWKPHESPDIFVKSGVDLRDPKVLTPPGGLEKIPTRKTLIEVYGDAKALGKEGMRARLVTVKGLPGRFNRGNGTLYDVHPKMAPHLRRALELCEDFGVVDEIYRIGTFNYRHMRHDPTRPLSFHSYGICMDVNSRENFGWTPAPKERDIRPFSAAWRQKYPRGLSEVAVLCFKKVGFAWGGDWPAFRDPMHFELVR